MNETLLKYLLSKGVNPNSLDDFNNIPLRLYSNQEAIEILIKYSTDISYTNLLYDITNILDNKEYIKRIGLVLKKGVDINAYTLYLGYTEPGSKVYNYSMDLIGNKGTALYQVVRRFKIRPKVNRVLQVKQLLERGVDKDI